MLNTIVLVIAGVVNMLLGWIAFLLWSAIQQERRARQAAEARLQDEVAKVENQITQHQTYAAETYVRRDDYRDDMAELKTMIRQIIDRLDGKADK